MSNFISPLKLLRNFLATVLTLFVAASENGHQDEKADEPVKENDGEPILENSHSEAAQTQPEEAEEKVIDEKPSDDAQQPPLQNLDDTQGQEKEPHISEAQQQGDDPSTQQEQPASDSETITRRMEVPNNKVACWVLT